jgi:hypothetical protein
MFSDYTEFGLVIEFMGLLKLMTAAAIAISLLYALYISL